MSRPSELEQRLLSELEEAGAEEVTTLINTIFPPQGHPDERAEFIAALSSLVRSGMVLMSVFGIDERWADALPDGSITLVEQLSTYLYFDQPANLWREDRRQGPPFKARLPMVVCTPAGKRLAFEILNERGYQWWRSKP